MQFKYIFKEKQRRKERSDGDRYQSELEKRCVPFLMLHSLCGFFSFPSLANSPVPDGRLPFFPCSYQSLFFPSILFVQIHVLPSWP